MGYPQYEFDVAGPFLMPIDDVFDVKQRGCVVVGRIVRGDVKRGESVEIVGAQHEIIRTRITGTERANPVNVEQHDYNQIGLLVAITDCSQLQKGMVLAAPHTIKARNQFEADVAVVSTELGGRRTAFVGGYKPRFVLYDRPYYCRISMPDDLESVMPDDRLRLVITLKEPAPIEKGTQFLLKERYKIVGIGVVSKLLDAK